VPFTELDASNPVHHVYSRYTQNVSTRVEKVLGALHSSSDGTPAHAITYSSGLAAMFAALVYLSPKRIALSEGFYGGFSTIRVFGQARGVDVPLISLEDDFKEGDIVWLETPMNPTGEAKDIRYYADKVSRCLLGIMLAG
jgi:cystathionine gamma-synthase